MTRIDAHTLNTIARRLRQIPRGSRTEEGADRRAVDQAFWAKLTGESAGGGAYSWTRMKPDGTGGLEEDPLQIAGTENAFEANGAADLADGTIVWLRFAGHVSAEPVYLFHASAALPGGTGQYKVLQLDAEDAPHWDYVRAHG